MSDTLSPSEQEKLDQFQIITSFKDEDYDKVVRLLKNNYWNLEVSISKYFDHGLLDVPTEEPLLNNNNDALVDIPADLLDDRPLQNLQQQNYSSLGVLPSLVRVSPISSSWKSQPGLIKRSNQAYSITESPILFLLLLIPKTITFFLLKIQELWEYFFPRLPNTLPDESTLDSFSFEAHYNKLTKDTIDFKISDLDYNETLELCIEGDKLLLLILIRDDDEVTTSNFLKKIINNSAIKEILQRESMIEDNLICYVGSVNEHQSFEIAKSLKVRTLPVAYMIGNVGSASSNFSSLSILAKIPLKTVNLFKSRLAREIDRFKPELVLRRLEKNELNFSRQIKKLQDDAFEESLKKDQLKKQQQEEAQRRQKEIADLARRKELNEKLFLIHVNKGYNERSLEGLAKGETTNIRIKLSNGNSITEKFSNEDTLLNLYSIVQLKIHLDSLSEESLKEFHSEASTVHAPLDDGYIHDFKFELISPFPRFTVPVENGTLIKDVAQLWPNGSLLVEFNEDDDEEEEEDV